MTKVILSGCSGKMGHAIVKAIDERNDCEIACGVDAYDCGDYDFTVYKSFSEITEKYDAIIDFTEESHWFNPFYKQPNVTVVWIEKPDENQKYGY